MTIRAGVVGNPVAHSLSPMIHTAWIKAAGLDAEYKAYPLPPGGFGEGIRDLARVLRGVNVTIPFKEEALALADETDEAARLAGAVNLLLFQANGKLVARNTDGLGLLAAFAEQAPDLRLAAAPIAVAGAGGAARGAVAALVAAGVPQVRILNRTLERAEILAAAFPGRARACRWEEMDAALAGVGAVVNATSLGLNGTSELALPLDRAPATAVVMDMVYKPLRTGFLKAAAARGMPTVDGLAMLIGQAAPSFEAFYGRAPPPDADVRGLCLEVLGEAR